MSQDETQNHRDVAPLPDTNRSWWWLGILWLGLLPVAGVCAEEPNDAVTELEGSWVITSATRDGKALDNENGGQMQMTFAGKDLTIKEKNGIELIVPFKVDPTSKPKAIEFRHISGGWLPINLAFQGIYELDRNKLKLCLGEGKRPTEFSDRDAIVIVLKRNKPPVLAVVVESEGLLLPPDIVATYVVQVTKQHPDFDKGEKVQIHLQPDVEILRGKDKVVAKPTGWAKGTRIYLDRYDGIQKSKPPQIYPDLIVLED